MYISLYTQVVSHLFLTSCILCYFGNYLDIYYNLHINLFRYYNFFLSFHKSQDKEQKIYLYKIPGNITRNIFLNPRVQLKTF